MYSRRTFLKQAGLMSAALSIPSYIHAAPKPSFKLGLQLYTIRDAMEKDLKKTLQRVSGFGYQEVETYGFNYGNNKDYWGLAPKDAKRLLDDCNLTTPTGHYDLDKFFGEGHSDADMKRYVDQCIEGAHALQQSYITWPWLSPENRTPEQFKKLAATLNTIGEQIKQGGLQLAYHNHGFEFDDHNGVTGYDIILKETDAALVKLQLDLYWLSHSSVIKPQDWFKQQPGRFVMWHIKDMDKVDRELHTTVGDGVIDFKSILQHHKIAGLKHIFVEQGNNYVPDDMSCVERSAKYVKASLLKRV
jgi:sugar phosphate isomerase/epimerase